MLILLQIYFITSNLTSRQLFDRMPVTLKVANHDGRQWKTPKTTTCDELLRHSSSEDYLQSKRIIQTSFDQETLEDDHVSPSQNGFVRAVYNAYSYHHHLTLRPEDIWFSILSQLGFYVKAHSEELRPFFVSHKGQKELEVFEFGNLDTVSVGDLAVRMTKLIEKNVVDPELRSWIMPKFSTTTSSDKVVAAVLMMGALQNYFSYKMCLACGIPSVTLLGERGDWVSLVNKLDKIPRLGKEPAKFAKLLQPVLKRFVTSFDSPPLRETRDFWGKCVHEIPGGSGPPYLSGWITAFCFWDDKGNPLDAGKRRGCELDGVKFYQIDIADIPAGFASVPVTVDDNGAVYKTNMIAGMVGIGVSSSGKSVDRAGNHDCHPLRVSERNRGRSSNKDDPEEPVLDTIYPVSGWWMYEKIGEKKVAPKSATKGANKNVPWERLGRSRAQKATGSVSG